MKFSINDLVLTLAEIPLPCYVNFRKGMIFTSLYSAEDIIQTLLTCLLNKYIHGVLDTVQQL